MHNLFENTFKFPQVAQTSRIHCSSYHNLDKLYCTSLQKLTSYSVYVFSVFFFL